MQLLKLRSIDFSKLKQQFEKETEKYTSHDIQNEQDNLTSDTMQLG